MIQKIPKGLFSLADVPPLIGPPHLPNDNVSNQAPQTADGEAALTLKKEEEVVEWITDEDHKSFDGLLTEPGLLALETPETELSSALEDVVDCELYSDPKRVGSSELCKMVHAISHTARSVVCLGRQDSAVLLSGVRHSL